MNARAPQPPRRPTPRPGIASTAMGVAMFFVEDTPDGVRMTAEGHRRLAEMACKRCRQLDCDDGEWCDLRPEEVEEWEERQRDRAGRPDADYDQVEVMCPWPLVAFPGEPEEGW